MLNKQVPLVRIIDDEETVRNSERFIFQLYGIESVCYASAKEFLESDDFTRPGCIVSDLRMEGMNGLELQQSLIDRHCDLPIVFLTGHGTIDAAVYALKKGACDFMQKPVPPQKLHEIVVKMIEDNLKARKELLHREELQVAFQELTAREKDVLRKVADGALNKQIAFDLGISEQTVKIHRANALHKLRIRTAIEVRTYLEEIGEF